MKIIIGAVALAAGLASASANPADTRAPAPHPAVETLTTAYAPREPFMHVAGARAYTGAFEAKSGACALTVQYGAVGAKEAEQIAFELPARQTIRFVGDEAGSAVRFTCINDGQGLIINQTWTSSGNAEAARLVGGPNL